MKPPKIRTQMYAKSNLMLNCSQEIVQLIIKVQMAYISHFEFASYHQIVERIFYFISEIL